MQGWGSGYVTDVEYTDGFYSAQAPAHLALAATLNGLEPPVLDESFTYCELGCGRGQTSLVLAAVNPQAQFHAIDFHPAHIAVAADRARRARLGNLSCHECGFQELTGPRGAAFPMFDVVTLHGVWSWIAPELQRAIVEFLNARLKPGGLVYVSYNALPAWNSVAPLQRVIKELTRLSPERSDRAVVRALEQVARLRAAKILPEKLDGDLQRIKDNADKMLAYVAHEYLNEHWQPVYHADVVRAFAEAKLTYAAAANIIQNFYNLVVTEEQHALLLELPSPELRETLRDFCTDHRFREDVFVRGARRMSEAQRAQRLARQSLTLLRPAPDVIEIARPDGSKWRPDVSVYQPIVAALKAGPREIRELLTMETVPEHHLVGPVELVGVLAGTGLAGLYKQPTAEERAASERLNALLDSEDEISLVRGAAVAVPAVRSGLTLSPAHYALYADLRRGLTPDAEALADRFIQRCREAGGHPVVDGKSYDDEDEARAAVVQDYEMKIEQLVPVWRMLGIVT